MIIFLFKFHWSTATAFPMTKCLISSEKSDCTEIKKPETIAPNVLCPGCIQAHPSPSPSVLKCKARWTWVSSQSLRWQCILPHAVLMAFGKETRDEWNFECISEIKCQVDSDHYKIFNAIPNLLDLLDGISGICSPSHQKLSWHLMCPHHPKGLDGSENNTWVIKFQKIIWFV